MNAILTGSRMYGEPNGDSDLDMVVLLSKADFEFLFSIADDVADEKSDVQKMKEHQEKYPDSPTFGNLRFGTLNLICTTDPIFFETWRRGTKELMLKADTSGPRTREEAVKVFSALRKKHGVQV